MQTNPNIHLKERLKALEARCRREGLKLTHQRIEIFRELASTDDHPSAEVIYKRVQARIPTISLDTVYRTLLTLERYGLISRVQAFDDHARFDAELSPHQHIACTQCRRVDDFHWQAFEDMNPPSTIRHWGNVESKAVILKGLCKDCLQQQRRKPI
jgi:Fur family peroxide stress response transcriptional regulator